MTNSICIIIKVYQPVYNMGPEGLEPSTASAPGIYPQNCGWYPTKLDDSPLRSIKMLPSFKLVYVI